MKTYKLRKMRGSEFVEQIFWYILVIIAASAVLLGFGGAIADAMQGVLDDLGILDGGGIQGGG